MDVRNLSALTASLERAQENLDKVNALFKYDTLDEADPKHERIRGDVTIELGGPSTHMKTGIMTREEHTTLKECITRILTCRIRDMESQIRKWAQSISAPA